MQARKGDQCQESEAMHILPLTPAHLGLPAHPSQTEGQQEPGTAQYARVVRHLSFLGSTIPEVREMTAFTRTKDNVPNTKGENDNDHSGKMSVSLWSLPFEDKHKQ